MKKRERGKKGSINGEEEPSLGEPGKNLLRWSVECGHPNNPQ